MLSDTLCEETLTKTKPHSSPAQSSETFCSLFFTNSDKPGEKKMLKKPAQDKDASYNLISVEWLIQYVFEETYLFFFQTKIFEV